MTPRKRNDDERVYNRLAVLRAERDLSRHDLAAALGIHYQTVGYLERGEYSPSLELALRISAYFGLPVEAVFALSPYPPLSTQVYPRQEADHDRERAAARVPEGARRRAGTAP